MGDVEDDWFEWRLQQVFCVQMQPARRRRAQLLTRTKARKCRIRIRIELGFGRMGWRIEWAVVILEVDMAASDPEALLQLGHVVREHNGKALRHRPGGGWCWSQWEGAAHHRGRAAQATRATGLMHSRPSRSVARAPCKCTPYNKELEYSDREGEGRGGEEGRTEE